MPFTITLVKRLPTRRGTIRRRYSLTAFTGSYVSSGGVEGTPGDTIDFTTVLNPSKLERPRPPGVINGSTANLPKTTDITVIRVPDGYDGYVEQNATAPTLQNYVLRLYSSGTSANEVGAATYASLDGGKFVADPVGVIFDVETPFKSN